MLAFGGMTLVERHFYLRCLGTIVHDRPAAVLFEASTAYELDPISTIWTNRKSTRMVDMMDWRSALESLRWIVWQGRDHTNWVTDFLGLLARHYLSFDAVSGAVPFEDMPAVDHTFALPGKASYFTPELYRERSATPALPEEAWSKFAWGRRQLDRMARTAAAAGARVTGVYGMPVLGHAERSYWERLCTDNRLCVVPDAGVMEELGPYEQWYDAQHLSAEGRRRFTLWFAARLAQQIKADDGLAP
jgi:hypothetical protein